MEVVEKCFCIISKDRAKALIKNSKGRVIGDVDSVKNIIRYLSKAIAENILECNNYELKNEIGNDFEVLECELKLVIK